jgi:hypothetical protein
VLKKAKKIANGKGDANLSLGAFVDTLVVHPDDLVQVIAKVDLFQWYINRNCLFTGIMALVLFPQGLTLPVKGVGGTPDCNAVAASGSLKPQTSHANDLKMYKTEYVCTYISSQFKLHDVSFCIIFITFGLYVIHPTWAQRK